MKHGKLSFATQDPEKHKRRMAWQHDRRKALKASLKGTATQDSLVYTAADGEQLRVEGIGVHSKERKVVAAVSSRGVDFDGVLQLEKLDEVNPLVDGLEKDASEEKQGVLALEEDGLEKGERGWIASPSRERREGRGKG